MRRDAIHIRAETGGSSPAFAPYPCIRGAQGLASRYRIDGRILRYGPRAVRPNNYRIPARGRPEKAAMTG